MKLQIASSMEIELLVMICVDVVIDESHQFFNVAL